MEIKEAIKNPAVIKKVLIGLGIVAAAVVAVVVIKNKMGVNAIEAGEEVVEVIGETPVV